MIFLQHSTFRIDGIALPTERYSPGETGKIIPVRFSGSNSVSGLEALSNCPPGGCIPIVVIHKEARYSNNTVSCGLLLCLEFNFLQAKPYMIHLELSDNVS